MLYQKTVCSASIDNKELNMPTVVQFNDKGSQHDGYHETVVTAVSTTTGSVPDKTVFKYGNFVNRTFTS